MNHPIDVLLSRLEGVKEISAGKYKARCPAHDDKSPSLSVTEKDGKVLIHCYAECEAEEIMTAMGRFTGDRSGSLIHVPGSGDS